MTIYFEPLHESHFPLLLKWIQAPHVKKWWDQDVAYTLELVRDKYQSYTKGYKIAEGAPKPIQAFIIYNDKNPVGYIQIYNPYDFPRSKKLSNLPEKLGAFDIFIGEEEALQQGLGSQAIAEFLKLHGNQYSHIFTDPDSRNIAAIKCYEKAGFKRIAEHEDTGEAWMIREVKKIRLSDHDLEALKFCFKKYFADGDRLWLFGSRADLTKKGGDIDLYVETYAENADIAMKMKFDFLAKLEEMIGEQKIDVVLNMMDNPYPLPIHQVALNEGVRII